MKYEYFLRLKSARRNEIFEKYLDTLTSEDWRELETVSRVIERFKKWVEEGGHLINTSHNQGSALPPNYRL